MKIGDLIVYRASTGSRPIMLVTKVEPDDSITKVGNIITVQAMRHGDSATKVHRVHSDWVEVLSESR
jgi:hydroxyacyl-ACP dehydratase HTD2-like protein with hotdog domain